MVSKRLLSAAKSMGYSGEEVIERIQKKYVEIIGEGRVYDLEELMKLTRIEPKLSEDVVQSMYEECIREGRFHVLGEWYKLTGIKPSKDIYKILIHYL